MLLENCSFASHDLRHPAQMDSVLAMEQGRVVSCG